MIIKFEVAQTSRVLLGAAKCIWWLIFDGLRLSRGERCLATERDEEKSSFGKYFSGFQEANDVLDALGERAAKAYRDLRTAGVVVVVVTSAPFKEALAPKVAAADLPPAPPS